MTLPPESTNRCEPNSSPRAPELLCPAGNPNAMKLAFAYGADAVYAGEPRYSLRVRNNSFTLDNLGESITYAHKLGKRFYVVVNIAPHNAKLTHFVSHMQQIVELQPDALIVSDPGVIMLLRQHFPHQALHLSVQANTVNWAALQFWQQQGIERVILSRELSLKEIAEMRQALPSMEIEVFVHGALCMAYSGRCLLSGYINKRDANQGTCTNACRWQYQSQAAVADAVGQYIPAAPATSELAEPLLLSESQRPDDLMLLDEDEHGSYIMNSKDLRAVDLVPELVNMGVHSLKIEGRTKSDYYVARTTQVYRQAIDDAVAGKPFNYDLLRQLAGMANRGFTHGFLQRHSAQDLQNYQQSHSVGSELLVGQLHSAVGTNGDYWVDVKNGFNADAELLLMTPHGNYVMDAASMRNEHGEQLLRAPGSGYRILLSLPQAMQGSLQDSDMAHCFIIQQMPAKADSAAQQE